MPRHKTVVVDNGANSLKFGFGGQPQSLIQTWRLSSNHLHNFASFANFHTTRNLGNYIARSKTEKRNYIGSVDETRDKFGLFFKRPFDRGFLTDWDTEKEIWDLMFQDMLKVDPSDVDLLVTETQMNPESVRKVQNEILFEQYKIRGLYTTSAPSLAMYNYQMENPNSVFAKSPCSIVLDTGYSFSHVVPFFDNHTINYGIKRVNIAGKALTNYLKEVISYRHWNVMEETYLMNVIKEKLCYVSLDFLKDLEITHQVGPNNTIQCEYVLPDYVTTHIGYIKGKEEPPKPTIASKVDASAQKREEQILRMNNERITIPELLFNPSDAGIHQAGVAEAITQSVNACHPDMKPSLYANILAVGGCTLFPNFKERLFNEVRSFAPEDMDVNIMIPEDPINYAWHGGCKFAAQPTWDRYVVTKAEYEEQGPIVCSRKFLV